MSDLEDIARAIVAKGKGILAADESSPTIAKRFKSIGVEPTETNRRDWRELLFTTQGVGEFISGVILFDETIRQQGSDGTPLPTLLEKQGIIPGIKVDTGAKALASAPDEKVTEGLDGLRDRLAEYHDLGARFTKWRAVIAIGDGLPSSYCVGVNAHAAAGPSIAWGYLPSEDDDEVEVGPVGTGSGIFIDLSASERDFSFAVYGRVGLDIELKNGFTFGVSARYAEHEFDFGSRGELNLDEMQFFLTLGSKI